MVRILMLVTNDINPDPRVEREATALVSEGYEVRIIGLSLEEGPESFVQHANGFSILRIRLRSKLIERFQNGWIQTFFRVVLFSYNCLRKAKTLLRGVAIIHVHDFDTLLIGFLLSRMSNTKLIYDAHESYSEMFSDKVPRSIVVFVNTLEGIFSKRANRIISSGYLLGKRLERISSQKVDVIQNTVSEAVGSEFPRKEPLGFVIGYIGGFLNDRNLRELVEAFKIFCDSHPKSKLIFAGWGPLSQYLKSEARLNPSCFEFLGKIDYVDVPRILSKLSLSVVFGSRLIKNNHYATPNRVFESVSLGVPVLTSDFGEMKRIVTDWKFGIPVKSWNVNEIVSKLDYLYHNQDELWNLGLVARDTFIADLTWEKIKKKLLRLYNNILLM